MKKDVLVTGAAGFIGFHVCKKLIKKGFNVIGFDNLNSYYDIKLKKDRLIEIDSLNPKNNKWKFVKGELINKNKLMTIFETYKPSIVIHLAAQAGVRYSLENPDSYVQSNLVGFNNILECIRKFPLEHFLYASSSSVYGGNKKIPFSEIDVVDNPISLYAATKKSNELMAHAYSHLFNIPSTGMRFFTVYGPWGRPDMAPMIFAKSICDGKPIKIFNKGKMSRDFTYIDDVVEAIFRLMKSIPNNEDLYRIVNIGNSKPVNLMHFIEIIEKELGLEALKRYVPIQPGDVEKTFADNKELYKLIEFEPSINLDLGIKKFINWYKKYYKVS